MCSASIDSKKKVKKRGQSHFFEKMTLTPFLCSFFLFKACLLCAATIFPVHLYVDEEYRTDAYWQRNLTAVLEDVTVRYMTEFDIGFTWNEPVYWESDNSHRNIFDLLDQLSRDTANLAPGIVVGITGQSGLQGNELGVARYFTGHVVVKRTDYIVDTLVHEIGHIFGAVHVEGSPFIMNAQYTGQPHLPFDIWNSKIIILNNNRTFDAIGYPVNNKKAVLVANIYKELLNFGRSDKALYISLGSVFSTIGAHDEAVQILREAETYFYMESLNSDADKGKNLDYLKRARESLGYSLYYAGDYHEAVSVLEKQYEEDPGNNFVQWNLAASYMRIDDYFRAKELFENLYARLPESIPLALNIGYVYEKMGIPSMAEEKYLWVIRRSTSSLDGYSNLGNLYGKQGQWDKVIQYLTEAEKINNREAWLYEMRGIAYDKRQDKQNALQDYTTALRHDPSLKAARYNAGLIYFQKEKYSKAWNEFKALVKHYPEYAPGYEALGVSYMKLEEYKKAQKMLEKAVKLDNTLSDAYANLYYIYKRFNLEKKAQKAAKRYKKLTGKEL